MSSSFWRLCLYKHFPSRDLSALCTCTWTHIPKYPHGPPSSKANSSHHNGKMKSLVGNDLLHWLSLVQAGEKTCLSGRSSIHIFPCNVYWGQTYPSGASSIVQRTEEEEKEHTQMSSGREATHLFQHHSPSFLLRKLRHHLHTCGHLVALQYC